MDRHRDSAAVYEATTRVPLIEKVVLTIVPVHSSHDTRVSEFRSAPAFMFPELSPVAVEGFAIAILIVAGVRFSD